MPDYCAEFIRCQADMLPCTRGDGLEIIMGFPVFEYFNTILPWREIGMKLVRLYN